MSTNLQPPISNPRISNSPLWRTAWRRMRRRPFQYVLFVLGVALGVAMVVSVDLANQSASRAFQLSTNAIAGKTTHRIVGGPSGVDEDVYRQLRAGLGYRPSAPVVEGYVISEQLGEQPLRLVGVDPFAEPPFRDYLNPTAGTEGEGLEALIPFLARPGAVVISEDLAEEYGVELGQQLPLRISGREETVEVVGLLQPADEASRRSLRDVIFSDVATAQDTLDMEGQLSHVDLIAEDDSELAAIEAILPEGVRLEEAQARSNAVQQMTAAFELNLTALSLLALIVGMFLIYNTVTFSVVQRRRLFGILRSLGVTGGQLFRLILVEAAFLSFIGSLIGLALGVVLGRGMVGLVTQTINDFYFVVNVRQVSLPPTVFLKGLGIGIAAAIAASLLPAWEAMRTTPLSTLRRSTLESRSQQLLPWLVPAWLLVGSIGTFLLLLRDVNLMVTFAGLFAVLLSFALLAPPATVLLMRLAVPVLESMLGVLGRMAPRDIVRSLSRTSVAIAALMTAVAVIIGVSIMIGSFRETVNTWLTQTLRADVYVSSPSLTASQVNSSLPEEVVQRTAAWPGVEEVVMARNVTVQVPAFGREVELAAVTGDISRGRRDYAWINGGRETLFRRLQRDQGIIISEPLLLQEDLPIPPPAISLPTNEGLRSFPVLAVMYDYSSDRGTILMDRGLYMELFEDPQVTSLGLFLEPGIVPDEVVAALRQEFAGRQDVTVQSNAGVRSNALNIFDRTFAITAALQLLATVVAFIGVLSALMSLQLERARELGVLRATGMTVRQLWRLTLLETGLMGAIAGVLAMPTGYVLAVILSYVINVRSFGWTLNMEHEPIYFLQAFAVALIAALLAGVYPALRLGNMVIAEAIRQE